MKDLFEHFSIVLNNSASRKDRHCYNSRSVFNHLVLSSRKNLFAIRVMKRVLFLYTESDSSRAVQLRDYLQGSLGTMADFRNIVDVLAEEQKLKDELYRSKCVVLIGSRQASSLIHNKRAEIEDGYETFDGKLIHKEFTENKDLLKRLIIVFFTDRTKNDWVPADFDEGRIFNLEREKIRKGNPFLDYLLHIIRGILIEGE